MNNIYNEYVTVNTAVGGKIMTDERFIQKIITEVEKNFDKSEEQRNKDLPALDIPYSKRKYERVKRLLKQINNSSERFELQLLDNDNKYIKVIKKS